MQDFSVDVTVLLPLITQYCILKLAKVWPTPLWNSFSCVEWIINDVRWALLERSIGYLVSCGIWALDSRVIHLKTPKSLSRYKPNCFIKGVGVFWVGLGGLSLANSISSLRSSYTRKKHIQILFYFYVFSDAEFNGTIFEVVKVDLDLKNGDFQFC